MAFPIDKNLNVIESPKISIVIPSYNQGSFLEETFHSIFSQGYKNLEVIVMDGGSTDNTIDVIKKYEKSIHFWKSAPDGGQTDALLQGFDIVTGDLVGWQNSDDIYLPGSFDLVVGRYLSNNGGSGVYFGDMVSIDQEGKPIHHHRYTPFTVNELLFSGWNITNQSCFFTLDAIRSLSVSREYKYAMDAAIFLNIHSNGFKFYYINEFLGCLRMHDNTKTSSIGIDVGFNEWIKLRREYGIEMHTTKPWSKQFLLKKIYYKFRRLFFYSYFGFIKFLKRK